MECDNNDFFLLFSVALPTSHSDLMSNGREIFHISGRIKMRDCSKFIREVSEIEKRYSTEKSVQITSKKQEEEEKKHALISLLLQVVVFFLPLVYHTVLSIVICWSLFTRNRFNTPIP